MSAGKMRALEAMLFLTVVADGHPIIQPVPDSVLVVKRDADDEEMMVVYREDNRRTRKTVRGHYWNLEYDVGNDLARDAIIAHFVAEKDRLRGVVRRQAGNRLTFTVMRDNGGESWCQVWATDGNYTLEIVDEPPPDHEPFDQAPRPSATIVFSRDEAELDDDAERTLDVIANWLEAHPRVAAEVRGHRGPLEDPLLVEQRAGAVAAAIIDRGIAEERLTVGADDSNQGFEVTVVTSSSP
jgi:hypothetical protein